MLKLISDGLLRISSGKVTLGTLAVFLLFGALAMPIHAAHVAAFAGTAGVPDKSFWYSANDLYVMAEAYQDEGRESYVSTSFSLDLAWPLVYGAFLIAGISWAYGKAVAEKSLWRRANLVPLLAALLDILENTTVSVVMLRYPAHTWGLDILATCLTPLKWIFVVGSFVLFLLGLAGALRQRIARK